VPAPSFEFAATGGEDIAQPVCVRTVRQGDHVASLTLGDSGN
jgi:hypothetical protein